MICGHLLFSLPHGVIKVLTAETLSLLLTKLDGLPICAGQPDVHFVKMVAAKKGKIISPDGKVAAYVDDDTCTKTIRTGDCELICPTPKCESCKSYRANLRSMYNRWSKHRAFDGSDTSSHTNDRYLNTPEKKAKLDGLRKRVYAAEEEVKRLKDKVRTLLKQGDTVDSELHSDLLHIMNENVDQIRKAYPENSFSRLFWDEQLKAASTKDPRQVRWHPVLIKWCLNLKLLSSSAYHAMRTSGFLKLPLVRTLRDYVHYFSNRPGFQKEVHQQLLKEAKIESLPENRRFFSLILDEMKIKEGLVYNKHSGEMIGFTHLGDINNELMKLEQGNEHPPIANHVLIIMVRGLLFKLEFPYAHFGTEGVTADVLYPIVWEAIRLLEADGVKVLCVTADKIIGLIYRQFYSWSSQQTLLRLYTSLVRPHLEYATQVWNPYLMKDIQKLENVQKFALKVCCKRWDLTYAEALEQTALPDLKARRTHLNLCYFYKLNGGFEFPNSPLTTRQLNYPTRSGRTNLYYQPYAHSNSFLHSFFPQTISLWNSLPFSIASAPTFNCYKRLLLSYV